MKPKQTLLSALAIGLIAQTAAATEAAWPKESASELSVYVALLKYRGPADHCAATVPGLKPEFEALMDDLGNRIQRIAQDVLAGERFTGMKGKPVPEEIIRAFKDSFSDTRHNFERRDAAVACPKSLQSLGAMDDEVLQSDLTEVLITVQNMLRNLGH